MKSSMKWSPAGTALAAACAEYVKDGKATVREFDDIVRETRNAITPGQRCKIKTIDLAELQQKIDTAA